MTEFDRLYTQLERMEERQKEHGELLTRLELTVNGNGIGPGLSDRLFHVEAGIARHNGVVERLAVELPGVSARLSLLETFEEREHGALRFLAIGIPIVVAAGGLVVAIIVAV